MLRSARRYATSGKNVPLGLPVTGIPQTRTLPNLSPKPMIRAKSGPQTFWKTRRDHEKILDRFVARRYWVGLFVGCGVARSTNRAAAACTRSQDRCVLGNHGFCED